MNDATRLEEGCTATLRVICLRGATWRLYPCELWGGAPNGSGYGMIYVLGSGKKNPKYIGVHRQALVQKLGRPVRQGYDACHHCDVKLCIQPEHLYEGTRKENMQDVRERGRCGRPSILTEEQKAEVRSRYAAGGVYQRDLAREFGVTQWTIWNTLRTASL